MPSKHIAALESHMPRMVWQIVPDFSMDICARNGAVAAGKASHGVSLA